MRSHLQRNIILQAIAGRSGGKEQLFVDFERDLFGCFCVTTRSSGGVRPLRSEICETWEQASIAAGAAIHEALSKGYRVVPSAGETHLPPRRRTRRENRG